MKLMNMKLVNKKFIPLVVIIGLALVLAVFGAGKKALWVYHNMVDLSPDSQVIFSCDVVTDSSVYTMGIKANPWNQYFGRYYVYVPQTGMPVDPDSGTILYRTGYGWCGWLDTMWVRIPYIPDTTWSTVPTMENYLRSDTLDTLEQSTFVLDTFYFSDGGADSSWITEDGTSFKFESDNYMQILALALFNDTILHNNRYINYGATDSTEVRSGGIFDIDSVGFDLGAYIINNHADSLLIEEAITALSGDLVVEGNDITFGSGGIIDEPHADTLDITETHVAISADSMVKINALAFNLGAVSTNSITNRTNFVWGEDNVITNNNAIYAVIMGEADTVDGGTNCFLFGGANKLGQYSYSIVGGYANKVESAKSAIFGEANVTTGGADKSIVCGVSDTLVGTADASAVFGSKNRLEPPVSFILGRDAKIYGTTSDTCSFIFGTGVIDSVPYSFLIGDATTDTLAKPHTFKVAVDTTIVEGDFLLDGAANNLTITDGGFLRFTDATEADSVSAVHDGASFVLTGDAATDNLELEGLNLELLNGALIENPHADTISIAETNIGLEGIVVLANGAVVDNPHADSITVNEANIKLEGIVTLVNGTIIDNPHADTISIAEGNIALEGALYLTGTQTFSTGTAIIDNPHADSLTLTETYIKLEGTTVFTNGATFTVPHADTFTITETNVKVVGNLHASAFIGAGDVWEDTANTFTVTQTINTSGAIADTGFVIQMDSTSAAANVFGLHIKGTHFNSGGDYLTLMENTTGVDRFSVTAAGWCEGTVFQATDYTRSPIYQAKANTDLLIGMQESDEFMVIGTENTTNGFWLLGHGDALADTVSGVHIDSSTVTFKKIATNHSDNVTIQYDLTGQDTLMKIIADTSASDRVAMALYISGESMNANTDYYIFAESGNGTDNFYVNPATGYFGNNLSVGATLNAWKYVNKLNSDLLIGMTESDEFMVIGTENTTNGFWLLGHGDALADTVSGIHIDSSTVTFKAIDVLYTKTVWSCNDLNISVPQLGTGNPPGEALVDEFPVHDYDKTTDEEVYFTECLTPSYKDGDSCLVDIDWFVANDASADTYVVWGVEYKMLTTDSIFDFTNTTTVLETVLVKTTDLEVHNTSIYLTTTGFVSGGRVKCRVFRDANNAADNYDGGDARVSLYRFAFKKEKP